MNTQTASKETWKEACQAMLFSFDEIKEKEGYQEALKRFCKAKRLAREALDLEFKQN